MVHRGELLEALQRALGDMSLVRCDSQCVGFEQDADGVTATSPTAAASAAPR